MTYRCSNPKMAISETADVCLIVEGCYPYVRGGVSSWTDWLMRSQGDLSFHIVGIWPQPADLESRYALPANVLSHSDLFLYDAPRPRRRGRLPNIDLDAVSSSLLGLLAEGDPARLRRLMDLTRGFTSGELTSSRAAWEIIRRMYEIYMPQVAFLDFFWAWQSLFGGLFATLEFPLPRARVYHAISTGYAGLVVARARLETGRPVMLTEHGIYTSERRMEILMADWIFDSLNKGFALDDPRPDLRDMWIAAFESYARICYASSDEIVTLYSANQILQRELGAMPERLSVVPNGIDVGRFADLPIAEPGAPPTIAFIGRVAPIKDVATFIEASAIIRNEVPDLRALILGPTDEDPEYFRECQQLVEEAGLGDFIEFMGSVSLADHLPQIHVVVLTSLSEAQPLVLLEAGAAGVACVATDVGACREILEGRADENPSLGPGGLITDIAAPDQVAAAVLSLIKDHDRRLSYGAALRQRVTAYYQASNVAAEYTKLYRRLGDRSGPLANQVAA